MTPLRRRMIEDMVLRDLATKTQEAYLHAVSALALFFGRAPDLLGPDSIRKFFLYLVNERKLSRSAVRQHLCGIRFFYETTLGRHWEVFELLQPKHGGVLPVVLSREEVKRLIDAVHSLKHRVMLLCAYCCGLRLSEILHLRISHIDPERMQLRVVGGKGRKDRNVPLSARVLERLREYWLDTRPQDLLSPSPYSPQRPLHAKSVQRLVKLAAADARISKNVSANVFCPVMCARLATSPTAAPRR